MKKFIKAVSFLAALLLALAGCTPELPAATTAGPSVSVPPTTLTVPGNTEQSLPATNPGWYTDAVTEPEAPAASYVISFAGDCTFADNYTWVNAGGGFLSAVKDRYDYPLKGVREFFLADDYSLVNLECALTESDPTEEEMEELKEHTYRFRGPMEYAKILVEGGVEFASCGNNHSKDYGMQGLRDTWKALENEQIDYASFGKNCVTTTESGLTLGIFTVFFGTTQAAVENQVKNLKSRGAEIIIMSIHWGEERVYVPSAYQENLGRMAIDAGVDIVYGHHSHTLMPVESYHGGIIYYSLGNFSFGGNRNPADKDTAVFQQEILRMKDGTVKLGDLHVIPCRISSVPNWNNYQPTPYGVEDEGYARVFAKLEATFEDYEVELPDYLLPEPTEEE